MNFIKVHIIVEGLVQGIGYRYFVKKLAGKYNLSGYVRNNSDGSVEIETEIEKDILNNFIEELKTGHPWAEVKSIKIKEYPYSGEFLDFKII